MSLADQLTLARATAVPLVIALFVWDFGGHDWWATGVFIGAMSTDWFDGRVARWRGHSSSLGSLLDPVADKLVVNDCADRAHRPRRVPGLGGRGDRRA
jgi:CDP-diacylglycerol--glycerol-3-phosphate 3-phosphatidyltransferase